MTDTRTESPKIDTRTGPGPLPPPGLDDVRLVEDGVITYRDLSGAVREQPDAALTFRLSFLSDCRAVRFLADGRLLALRPLLLGRTQLCVGTIERLSEMLGAWDDVWDYESAMTGLLGLASWEPGQGEVEPRGWVRHPDSGRRRLHGDPDTEEVRP